MARRRQQVSRNSRSRPRRSGNQSNKAGSISPVAFHSINTITLSGVTGNSTSNVSPQGGALFGVSDVADQFDLFRVSELEYRIHPMDPTDTTNQALVFYPDIDIQTQTVGQASLSPIAALQTPFCGVPSPWIRVPRSQLKGMLDWYKCTADAGAAEFESQGLLCAVGGLSDVINYEVRGVILFKNPVSAAVMLSRTISRAEKAGLVIRLPPPPSAPTPVKNGVVTPQQGCTKNFS